MSNFGFSRLRLVNPYQLAFREARSAVGAADVLAEACEYPGVAEAVADCTMVVGTTSIGHRALQHPLRRLESGGRLFRKHLAAGGPAALLFGSEKHGLSNEDLAHCHWLIRIPTRGEHGSMNLGQAVAVCLYELVRSPRAVSAALMPVRPAPGADLERISSRLLEALEACGYVNPKTRASTELKVRRMVRRLGIPARDAEIWLGMLRQMLWKMRGAKDPAGTTR